jgi:hypothetical protein
MQRRNNLRALGTLTVLTRGATILRMIPGAECKGTYGLFEGRRQKNLTQAKLQSPGR